MIMIALKYLLGPTGRYIVFAIAILGAIAWIRADAASKAVAARDAHWERQIEKANAEIKAASDERIAAALEDAKAVSPTPSDRAALAKLCAADPNCLKVKK